MEFKVLPKVEEDKKMYETIEKILLDFFKKEIYEPLLKELEVSKTTLKNSVDDLVGAIMAGQINYYRGKFVGKWSASLSKEMRKLGAVWDRKEGAYKLPRNKMPIRLKSAVDQSQAYWQQKMMKIDKKILSFNTSELVKKIKLEKIFEKELYKYNKEIEDQIKQITVEPVMTEERLKFIAKNYSTNTELDIKKFLDKEIFELRDKMNMSVFEGKRAAAMVDDIQKSYGVTSRKAKFLARQETRLLMGTFKEQRMIEADIDYYAWRCVTATAKGHEVRPRHQELNDLSTRGLAELKKGKSLEEVYNMGLIFKYSNPPVVDEKTKRTANAGMDFNCRCYSRSLVEFKKK